MLPNAPWPAAVIFGKGTHFCKDRNDIKATFNDYETIFSTGAHTQFSWPLVDEQGDVVGAVNCSGVEGSYSDQKERDSAVKRFGKEGLEAYRKWADK